MKWWNGSKNNNLRLNIWFILINLKNNKHNGKNIFFKKIQLFEVNKLTLGPKADKNHISIKNKKIQARTKERSCFITAYIDDTNEVKILI